MCAAAFEAKSSEVVGALQEVHGAEIVRLSEASDALLENFKRCAVEGMSREGAQAFDQRHAISTALLVSTVIAMCSNAERVVYAAHTL